MPVHVGDRAVTRTPLRPTGRIEVAGQLYDARSEREFIDAGVACIILRGEFRNLIVRPVQPEDSAPSLEKIGQPIDTHIFERTAKEVEEAHRRSENERLAPWQRWVSGLISAMSLGGAFGIGSATMAWLLGKFGDQGSEPKMVALLLGLITLIGIVWGLFLFIIQYEILPILSVVLDEELRPSFIVVFCGLVGTVIGAWPSRPDMHWNELIVPGLIGAIAGFVVGIPIAGMVQMVMRKPMQR